MAAAWAAAECGSGAMATRTSAVSRSPAPPRTSATSTYRSVYRLIGPPAISAHAAGAHRTPTAQPVPVSVVVDRPETTP